MKEFMSNFLSEESTNSIKENVSQSLQEDAFSHQGAPSNASLKDVELSVPHATEDDILSQESRPDSNIYHSTGKIKKRFRNHLESKRPLLDHIDDKKLRSGKKDNDSKDTSTNHMALFIPVVVISGLYWVARRR